MVSDPSGAPVPGATVTATNVARNTPVQGASNESGIFTLPFLTPGTYVLTVEHAGFKKFIRQNIDLQAMEQARVDVKLEIGQAAESVTVSESVSALQTETASRSQLISQQLVKDVPTQGRNIMQLAWSAAGVVKSGDWRYLRSWDIGGSSGFSVNGGKNKENEVLMDGISNVQADRTIIHIPTVETVQEFKVLTNTYDAQYGRTGGGIVSIVTKGGGNEIHGSVFDNWQGSALNANTSELNRGGIKKPAAVINNYGINASGPVYIPKLFDGRNKLFWLVSYEGVKQRNADPGVYTFPLTEWRGGDFSTLFNASGAQVGVYDPLTVDRATGKRQAFAGNRLPTSRLSKAALESFKYYPAPNAPGDNASHVNNYIFPSRWIADMNGWTGRMDYAINSKNNVYFKYGENPYEEYRSLVFVTDISQKNPAEPSGNSPLRRNGRIWVGDWTSTLTPRMTLDLRFGLSRWEYTGGSTMGAGYDPRQLGFADSLVAQFRVLQFPRMSLGSYQGVGSSVQNYGSQDTYSLQPNMNFISGKHVMKWGVEARQYKQNDVNPGAASGTYAFSKVWTQLDAFRGDATSGNEVASFLLGYPASGSVDNNFAPTWLHRYYALFFNDDYKVSSRFTVNLGIRWDYEAPNYERFDRMVRGLDTTVPSPIAPQVQGFAAKGAVLFAGLNGQPRYGFQTDKNNFQPRIGAAYRLGDKWVLRGGYGLYYLGQNENGSTAGFSRTTAVINSVDGYLPAVNMTNPFANYAGGMLLAPIGNSKGTSSFLGEGLQSLYFDRPLPYSHQYSIDIQRELPGDLMLEFGYVGNSTKNVPLNLAANYVPADQLGRRTPSGAIDTAYYQAQAPNPFAGLIPNNATLNAPTVQRQILMYNYPQFNGVNMSSVPIGGNRYHGFQTKFSKRYSHGLTLVGSYTIMKNLETMNILSPQDFVQSDPSQTRLEKRSAKEIDIPQKFAVTAVWEVPLGKGRQFANSSKALDYLIGGWQLNANVALQSGWVWNYPNANQLTTGSAKLDNPTREKWFNTSLWAGAKAQEPFTLRNFPTRFGDVRGPGYKNLDASVSKYFPIHEQVRMQFRCEMINAFNHPWFPNPASGGTDVTNANFGRLDPTQRNLPRWFKLALYLHW
jgi:hypothetical protein